MPAQFNPPPGPGAAPYAARPSSPRGLYRTFGAPESLVRIHFPRADNGNTATQSAPWFWWYTRQQPAYFSFLFTEWVRLNAFSIIKILQIDPRQPIPTPFVGVNTLEAAIKSEQPDVAWGRFRFRNEHFWELMRDNGSQNRGQPRAMPAFDTVNGMPTARPNTGNISQIIRKAVTGWKTNWNTEAATYNAIAAAVPGTGFHYPGQPSLYSVPLPAGPPTTITTFQNSLENFRAYLGPIPGSAFFNINTFTTQAYAFVLNVGQLNDQRWNMSTFPPLDSTIIGNGSASRISRDYGGYGQTDLLYAGPQLV